MIIKGIIWLDEIVEKLLRKHNVQQDEIKEALLNRPRFRFVEKGYRKDENVYAAMSRTNEGRYLIVFFVYKHDQNALILSARDMTKAERRLYETK